MQAITLAIVLASIATVQAPPPPASLAPAVDSVSERAALRTLGLCLAKARPDWAVQTLANPYLGDRQTVAAGEALSGSDSCVKKDRQEFTFRTSGIVASLAESRLRAGLDSLPAERLATAIKDVPAANASEDFALCLASRDPKAAQTLVLSEPGSEEESGSAARFIPFLNACSASGEHLTVDQQALRGLLSIALYRGATALGRP